MKSISITSFIFCFVAFSFNIIVNAQNTNFKKINNTNTSAIQLNEDIRDVIDLNSWSPGDNNGGSFNISSIENSKIVESLQNVNVIPLKAQGRELPVALYIKNSNSITGESNIVALTKKLLGDSMVKAKMKIKNENNFHIVSVETDELGITHIKMDQYYKGIPIFGGQIYLHVRRNNELNSDGKLNYSFINGKWFNEVENSQKNNFDALPSNDISKSEFSISADRAKEIAIQDLDGDGKNSIKDLSEIEKKILNKEQVKFEKVYFPDEITGEFIPAYVVEIATDVLHQFKYIINAQTREVIRKQKEYCSFLPEEKHFSPCPSPDGAETANAKDLNNITRTINVYSSGGYYYLLDIARSMYNASQSQLPDNPVGGILTLDAKNSSPNNSDFNNKLDHVRSSNNTWPAGAVSAHYNAGYAYEYYKNLFNRNSIDNKGGTIYSIINVTDDDNTQMDNAFWGGTAMFYGNGKTAFTSPLARALDVSGHELTHGVIQNSANLTYYGEPGAINESFADVFGAMMDRDDWKMGEEVVNSTYFPTGALRDLSNPHNGGTSLNSNGWQPAHVNEQYHGTEDNAGVHINSGIPNYAFYKFATAVGKDKAEKVYYKALTNYLVKSSDFKDLRVAVEKSAEELYGADAKIAASDAFAAVGIGTGSGTGSNSQTDLQTNPGNDYIICSDGDFNGLYLFDDALNFVSNPLSTTEVYSKPSITDDGKHVVFVGADLKIHYIYLDWNAQNVNESIIHDDPIWRNAVLSKDGSMIAALTEDTDNKIHVYHFDIKQWKEFTLYNPTTAEGVDIGTVLFADAMDFDYSGQWLMYDCKNSVSSGIFDIEYWDIGFLNVWNNTSKNWSDGRIEKLFSGLPENVSIGNPVFAKNSPYIIAFDYLDESNYLIYGANLETGDLGVIFENNNLGYPNYSNTDSQVIFDYEDSNGSNVAIVDVDNTKINQVLNSASYFIEGGKWGVWFRNGTRSLTTSNKEVDLPIAKNTTIYPNPAKESINFRTKDFVSKTQINIYDILGNVVESANVDFKMDEYRMDISNLPNGQYIIKATDGEKLFTGKVLIFN